MDEEKQVNMSYNELCDIIKKYYKEKNIELDLMSNYSLISSIVHKKIAEPIFISHGGVGLVRFSLTLDDLNALIIKEYAKNNLEVVGDILYDENGIRFTTLTNSKALDKCKDNTTLSDITYSSSMSYDLVRQMLNDCYFKKYNKRLVFIDLRELCSTLKEGKDFVSLTNEKEFVTIPFNEIKDSLINYLKEKGFKVTNITFDEQILLTLHDYDNTEISKVEVVTTKTEKVKPEEVNDEEEKKEEQKTEPVKEIDDDEELSKEDIDELKGFFMPGLPVHDPALDDLLSYESIKYRYKLRELNLAIKEAENKKRKYAILSLILAACSIVVINTKRNELNKTAMQELEAFETWPTTIEYIEELGPLATILPVATGASLYQYNKNRKKVKRLRSQRIED